MQALSPVSDQSQVCCRQSERCGNVKAIAYILIDCLSGAGHDAQELRTWRAKPGTRWPQLSLNVWCECAHSTTEGCFARDV